MKKLLITGALKYTPNQIEQIRQQGCEVYFLQNESDALLPDHKGVEMVVCNGLFLHHVLSEFKNLRFIQLTSAGMDRVPVDEIKKKGILLFNARGVYSIPMAEWAVLRVLELYKNAKFFATNQQSQKWEKCRTLKELYGKNVGIVGAGNVGQEVAKRFFAFGANCIGYDLFDIRFPFFQKVVRVSELKAQMGDLDVVILTAPHTPDTHHIMDYGLLKTMKEGAVLVNIARGGLVCEKDLIRALQERKDLFAALDVFEEEPLSADSPLWSMENVVVSPHNSFVSEGNNERLFSVILDNIVNYIKNCR